MLPLLRLMESQAFLPYLMDDVQMNGCLISYYLEIRAPRT